ncbi:carcinine transporter-like [Centruroides sculpturatus]|uniref:carcinine transporter-like n=1 Tax=Centruroides sculpturatus TaxID=218467 RepID=UPI000C6E3833|nr:carcinine transporter-like [Centruroides sculpturatus]
MDFDDILGDMGHRQRYQKLVFYLLSVPCSIMSVLVLFNVVFLSATPDHWCRVPQLEEAISSPETIKNLSLPTEIRDGQLVYSRCQMYDVNYTALLERGVTGADAEWPRTDCRYGWNYDRSLYHETLVTQMDVVCDRSWMTSLAMSVFYAGSLFGNAIYGYVGDRFGRKPTLLIIILVDFAISFISVFSPNYSFYVGCRALLGLGFPSLYRISFIMAIELMIPERRARCGMLYCIFFSFSMMLLAGIAYLIRNWVYLALATSLPFAILLVYWWFVTESPRWYLSHNHLEKAECVIQKIAKFNGKTLPEDYLQNLASLQDVNVEHNPKEPKPSLLDLVRTPNLRKKFIIINFVWIAIAFDYSGLSLGSTSLGVNDYVAFCISALVELPGIIIAWFTMERIGRRWTMCVAMLLGGSSLISTGFIPSGYVWTTFALSNIGKLGISGSFAVIYVFASELVPTVLRSLALATCSFTSGFVLILAPQLLYMAETYGRALPLTVFGILSLIGGVLILLLPETLNSHLPQTVEESEKYGKKFKFLSCPWSKPDTNETEQM